MSEKLYSPYSIVCNIALGGVYTEVDLAQFLNQYAEKVGCCDIDDEGNALFPIEDCYNVICSVLNGHLRETIRQQCINNNIPAPLLEPQGALDVAIYQHKMANDIERPFEERQQYQRSACHWYNLAHNCEQPEKYLRQMACAGLICTLFNYCKDDENDESLWALQLPPHFNKFLDNIICSGLNFYSNILVLKFNVHEKVVAFAKASIQQFFLSACALSRFGHVYLYNDSKYFLYEITKKLEIVVPYLMNLLLAWVLIEHPCYYLTNKTESLQNIRQSALHYNRSDWLISAEKKCELHYRSRNKKLLLI